MTQPIEIQRQISIQWQFKHCHKELKGEIAMDQTGLSVAEVVDAAASA